MLTLTPTASAAVNALLDNPDLPEGAGLRLQVQPGTDGRAGIGIEIVPAPQDGDQLVPAGDGHDLYLSPEVTGALEDQVLDADLKDVRVSFSLHRADSGGQR
ncbi:hypothetical protein [Conexibacter sp. DBS9H8]|uniref:hypothetical protein n=1 Tax=Conexibacter sp. DBS9H8 TaxID=2937801 RepID=UPI00200C8E73|nr:hypothetical protein [Conexibacter sp. DBS9H8]